MSRSAYRKPRLALVLGGYLCLVGLAESTEAASALGPESPRDDDTLEEIVVTGSHIARPDTERLQPTVVLTGEYLDLRGITNVLDALDELPAFGEPPNSRIGAQTSEGVGQSFADLYSLGARRTLTLVDGRRYVSSASPSPNGPTGGFGGDQVDLNDIPTQLIDRIETISVGGAPIYGSDAIAGTINIILKHDYQGADFDAQGGFAEHGGAGQWRVRGLAGTNFDAGRGNITLSAEFAQLSGLNGEQRTRTAENILFIEPTGSSSYQYQLASNVRNPGFSQNYFPSLVDDGFVSITPQLAITNAAGQPLAFNNGHLVPYALGAVDASGFSAVGGDGLSRASIEPLLAPQQRTNVTSLGHFQLNDNVRLFAELMYSYTHTSSPFNLITSDQGASGEPAGQPQGNLILQLDNPFLSPSDRATIAQNLAAYAAASPLNPQQTSQFYLSRVNQDIGDGESTANQNTRRAVLGMDGTVPLFGKDLKYEVSANYGDSTNTSVTPQPNFTNLQNALNAIAGPSGQIICNPYQANGKPIVNSTVPTESSICAPFNPFGYGLASPAALAYVTSLGVETSTLTQRDFNASISGPLFTLPAGALKAAFGYENRRESAAYNANSFFTQEGGYYTYYAPFVPISGAYHTNEVFGEVLVPVVAPEQSTPGIHRLELEAAVREVDHSVAGKATSWTAGLRFEPVAMLQLRGNYTHSIRSPSISEAYIPSSPHTAYANDPCDQTQITSGPNPALRAANCAKSGIQQPFNSAIDYIGAASVNSGNPKLGNEVASARTVGFVLRPLTRMNLTIDYVSIDIAQAINQITAGEALDACYDSPSYPNNTFCSDFTRNSAGQVSYVHTGYGNFGGEKFNGVQTQLDWSFDLPVAGHLGALGTLELRINEFFLNRDSVAIGPDLYQDAGALGESRHKGVVDLNWRRGRLFALWQASVTGRAVWQEGQPANVSVQPGVAAWWVNNLTVGFQYDKHLKVELIVDNAFDKQPPYPLPSTPYGSNYFTYFSGLLGRYFTLQAAYKL